MKRSWNNSFASLYIKTTCFWMERSVNCFTMTLEGCVPAALTWIYPNSRGKWTQCDDWQWWWPVQEWDRTPRFLRRARSRTWSLFQFPLNKTAIIPSLPLPLEVFVNGPVPNVGPPTGEEESKWWVGGREAPLSTWPHGAVRGYFKWNGQWCTSLAQQHLLSSHYGQGTVLGSEAFSIQSLPSRDLKSVVDRILWWPLRFLPLVHTPCMIPGTCDCDTIITPLIRSWHTAQLTKKGRLPGWAWLNHVSLKGDSAHPEEQTGSMRGIQCQEGSLLLVLKMERDTGKWLLGIERDLRSTTTEQTETSVLQLQGTELCQQLEWAPRQILSQSNLQIKPSGHHNFSLARAWAENLVMLCLVFILTELWYNKPVLF